jgi:hypothetical protein
MDSEEEALIAQVSLPPHLLDDVRDIVEEPT